MQQGSMFTARRRPRQPRPPSDLDRDLQTFRDAYVAHQQRPFRRASQQQWREDARHLKRLQTLVPDAETRHAFLNLYAADTDPFIVTSGHLLRHALLEWRFQRLVYRAEQAVADHAYLASLTPAPQDEARFAARVAKRHAQNAALLKAQAS